MHSFVEIAVMTGGQGRMSAWPPAGARLDAVEYHRPYDRFAEALWAMRVAVRAEVGQPAFTPQALDRTDWSDHERCAGRTPPD